MGLFAYGGGSWLDDAKLWIDEAGGSNFNKQVFNDGFSSASITPTHDDNGNQPGDGTRTLKWDAWNRLREVVIGGSTVGIYTYDATGRRVRKDLSGFVNDIDLYFLGWQEIEERPAGSGDPRRQWVYGAFIDEPLVMNPGQAFERQSRHFGSRQI